MLKRLAGSGLLVVILCAAFSPVLFGDRTFSSAAWLPGVLPSGPAEHPERPEGPPPVRDIEGASWVDEPAPYLVHRGLAAGTAPLWNDRAGLGLPLLGNPNMGALSPLQLPVNLAPSARMQDLAWALRPLLLGLFTLGLARELGLDWIPALASAVGLMLSGQTVEWIEHHPLNTDVFVPAALWAAVAVRRIGLRAVPWLACAVGAGLLGVKPQSAIMAGGFGLFWLIADALDRPKEGAGTLLGPRLAGWALGTLLGVGLAAVALAPFAETYDGASGLVRAGRTTQSLLTLPLASVSHLGGALAVGLQNWVMHGPAGGEPPPAGLPYAGLTVLAGAGFGFWATRMSWLTRALAVTIALELLRVHGLFPVPLGALPIVGSINFVKYCFPLYLALALLVGRGLQALPMPAAAVGLVVVAAELLWLVPRDWAERVAPYAAAPWTSELARLEDDRSGRISGPFRLAPPLVSAALGFRDLRSIDVLTPRDTYDFVSRLVAPSQGMTWILADPEPILAATGPGANVADLRWIVSDSPFSADALPAAVRESTTSRRLVRLFGTMLRQEIETRSLSGGMHDGGRDRRFHWTCETPCRFDFQYPDLPEHFVAGLAAPEPVKLGVRLGIRGRDAPLRPVVASTGWKDEWLDLGERTGTDGTIVLEIQSESPAVVFVGGVGPAPSPDVESAREIEELAHRLRALAHLELRYRGEGVYVYENPGALGEAFLAARVVSVEDREAAFVCVAEHPGEAVACVPRDQRDARRLPPGSEGGRVEIVRSEAGKVHVAVEAPGPGVLVLSRLYDPSWRVSVDGRPVESYKTNGALLGVSLDGGAHDVRIEYAPSSIRLGLAITVLAACLIGLVAVRARTRPDASV